MGEVERLQEVSKEIEYSDRCGVRKYHSKKKKERWSCSEVLVQRTWEILIIMQAWVMKKGIFEGHAGK